MDPNNTQPQGSNANLSKLEEDLQKLTKEAAAPAPTATTPAPPPPAPTPTQVTDAQPVATMQTAPVSDEPKKSSPLLVVALVLMVIAILAVIAYVVGVRYFTPQTTPVPIATISSEVLPTEVPMIPTAIVTPLASASASPTSSASATPSAVPTVHPTATP